MRACNLNDRDLSHIALALKPETALKMNINLKVLDISYNAITGTGIKIIKDEPAEGEKLSPKKSPKKGLKSEKNQSTVGKGFAELFH